MDVVSKNLFRHRSNVRNFEPSPKRKVGHKGKTFYFKRRNYVHSGTRQQNV